MPQLLLDRPTMRRISAALRLQFLEAGSRALPKPTHGATGATEAHEGSLSGDGKAVSARYVRFGSFLRAAR